MLMLRLTLFIVVARIRFDDWLLASYYYSVSIGFWTMDDIGQSLLSGFIRIRPRSAAIQLLMLTAP